MTEPLQRPDHPDFFKLSAAVIDNDTAADNGASFMDVLKQVGLTDAESLAYMAGQRVLRATHHNFHSPDTRMVFQSIYFDAFCLGARYAQNELATVRHAAAEEIEACLEDIRAGKGDPMAVLESIAARLA